MAHEEALRCISLPAAADLSAKQFYGIKVDTSGNAALAGAGEVVIGVLQNDPAAAGRAASVAVSGVTKVNFGGSVSKGDRLVTEAGGQFVTQGSDDQFSLGISLTDGADGEIGSMLIQPMTLNADQ